MKKILSIITIIACTGILSSCDDLFDVPAKSSMEESVIFSTLGLAEGAIAGIHQIFGEQNSYRGRYIPYYGVNTDIEIYNSSEQTTDRRGQLTGYAATPDNQEMNTENNAWAMMYQGIERANICIRGLRTYGNVENDPEFAQLLGEALTLRALIYADLIKGWGDVPARFEPVTPDDIYIPKSDRDIIYKQLIADLEEAAELVAWPLETAATKTVERVNKAFVKGLRARLCLASAGYSQRANGKVDKSSDPDLTVAKLYPIVIQECLDVINSNTSTLGTFEANFRGLCTEDISAGRESLWEIPFADGRGRVMYTLGVKHTNADKYTQLAAGGQNGPMPHVYYDYDPEDIRRDITCVPYEWTDGKQVPRKLSSWCFGKLRFEWMSRVVTSTNDDGINWQYMRYADIYLMLAEALNELQGPAAAAPYFRPIRERAFPNNVAKVNSYMEEITQDKNRFFQAIVDERALEFCGEMLRKGDLIRWNMLKTKMDEAKEKMTALANRKGDYADLPEKIYYSYASDGESLVIYGLEHGHTDEVGADLGYESNTTWIGTDKLNEAKINSIYQNNPDEYQFWPIWQVFINNSNGMLVNDYNY